ncbi:MAG: HEAT repeat domain-containing protein, partial [Deltaproteobacteria bacterium]|nr:HEAT repeat domain-containing protein [Deltaproteobacteria bacterium]
MVSYPTPTRLEPASGVPTHAAPELTPTPDLSEGHSTKADELLSILNSPAATQVPEEGVKPHSRDLDLAVLGDDFSELNESSALGDLEDELGITDDESEDDEELDDDLALVDDDLGELEDDLAVLEDQGADESDDLLEPPDDLLDRPPGSSTEASNEALAAFAFFDESAASEGSGVSIDLGASAGASADIEKVETAPLGVEPSSVSAAAVTEPEDGGAAWPAWQGLDVPVELGPSEPKLVQISSELTPLRVILGCAKARATGVLRFRLERVAIKLHFREGSIVAVDNRGAQQSFESFVADRGIGDRRAIVALPQRVREAPCDLALAMQKRGLVMPSVLRSAVEEWAESVIASVIPWESGVCQFMPGDAVAFPLLDGFDRLNAPLEALRELPVSSLLGKLELYSGEFLVPAEAAGLRFEDFALTSEEFAAVATLSRTVQELGLTLAAADDDVRPALARMMLLGLDSQLVRRVTQRERDQLRRAAAARQEVARLQAANPYAVLGLPEATPRAAIRDRIQQLKEEWRVDPDGEPDELTEARIELFRLYERAIQSITHSYQRQAEGAAAVALPKKPVSSSSVTPVRAAEGPDPDPAFAPPVNEEAIRRRTDASGLLGEFDQALKLGRHSDAIYMIDRALWLGLSGDGKSRAQAARAYAVALTASTNDRMDFAKKAIAQIREIMSSRPFPDGYVAIGRLAKRSRDTTGALEAFQAALNLDPKHADAKTELNMISRRGASTAELLSERSLSGKAFAALSSLGKKIQAGDRSGKTHPESLSKVQELITRLDDSDSEAVIRAVRELGKLGDAEAVDPLVTLLGTTTQTDLIDALIRALADLGDVRAIPTLKACAARAPVGTT